MNTILKTRKFSNWILLLCATLSLTVHGCKTTNDTIESGEATVLITLSDEIVADELEASTHSANRYSTAQTNIIKDTLITTDGCRSMQVTMEDVTYASSNEKLASVGNLIAASQTVRAPIANGVKYKLLVYDAAGDLKTERTYTVGTNVEGDTLQMDAGKDYTFVAYSINTGSLPEVQNKGKLSTASLNTISADLMYYKKKVTNLNPGLTNLGIILKHQFSQITTIMKMDDSMTGNITAVGSPKFASTYASANLAFTDNATDFSNSITYNGNRNVSTTVSFPTIATGGVRSISSTPTLLINPTASDLSLAFPANSITRDGETIAVANAVNSVKVQPGHKYNLVMVFKTCTQDVPGGATIDWTYAASGNGATKDGIFYPLGSVIESEFTAPGADYGFQFLLTKLDNSFNMEVNGVKMATREIQFQANAQSKQNVEFIDGSQYEGSNTHVITGESSNIPAIWSMNGTTATPVVKVLISRFGEVTMLGSKVSGGALYPLRFKLTTTDGNVITKFNTFPWNTSGQNNVKVTQLVDGLTEMKGTGSGKKRCD